MLNKGKFVQTSTAILLIILFLSGMGLICQAAIDPVRIRVDGEYIQLRYGQYPVIVEGHMLVPIRDVMSCLGFTVDCDPQSATIRLEKPGFSILIKIGSNTMMVNDKVVCLEVPAQIITKGPMIPLRAISEAIGLTVHWTSEAKSVDIRTDASRPLFTSEPLPDKIIEYITGKSFRESTTFPYSYLTYLTITYVDFDGEDKIGHMIVAAEVGDEVLDIFREIYESGFPIYRMQLVDNYDASDNQSMGANNTSAFNFRNIAGTNMLSRHALGMAIDINPIQNPYISGSYVSPPVAKECLDRTNVRPGMIIKGDVVYQAFTSRGWSWGGDWIYNRDYQHFEKN